MSRPARPEAFLGLTARRDPSTLVQTGDGRFVFDLRLEQVRLSELIDQAGIFVGTTPSGSGELDARRSIDIAPGDRT